MARDVDYRVVPLPEVWPGKQTPTWQQRAAYDDVQTARRVLAAHHGLHAAVSA